MGNTPTPRAVMRAQRDLGAHLRRWRKLQQLSAAQVADRAGVSRQVISRMENGEGTTLENFLRTARALGVLDGVVSATDPMSDEVGRLRTDEHLPQRIRSPRVSPADGVAVHLVDDTP